MEGLIKDWNVKVVSFEKDSEAIWAKRDNLVKEMSKKNEVQIIERVSHTLYDPEDIFNMNDNLPPNTCKYKKKIFFGYRGLDHACRNF